MKKFITLTLIILTIPVFAVTQNANKPYKFGIHVTILNEKLPLSTRIKGYEDFTSSLEKILHHKVNLVIFHNSQTLTKELADGKIDFAYMLVTPFLIAKAEKLPVNKLLTVTTRNYTNGNTENSTKYSSYIVTLKENKSINSINDLKGKIFGFTSKYSASGFIYPVDFFKSHNIDYKTFFSKSIFTDGYYDLLQAIKDKKVDAGAVWDDNYQINKALTAYKIIAKINNIPNPVIAVSTKSLSQEQQAALKKALLNVPRKNFKGLTFCGFANTSDELYTKEIPKILEMNKTPEN